MAKQIAEMLVESAIMELPDTKLLRLQWPQGYNLDFKTGQFITLFFQDSPAYKRAYSLCSCALDRGFYEVTVKRDGKMGTRIVDWVQPGDKMIVIPPAGRFLPVFEAERHLICIAGGSGVTPFRAFVREATRRALATRITILYSVRTPDDIIFDKEFRALEQANPNFKYLVTCTRLGPDDAWPGRRGRIDAAWVREQVVDATKTVFYACGPNPLVEATEHLVIEEMKVPKEQMIVEKWG
jgi:ferredoxin-NADP reductase